MNNEQEVINNIIKKYHLDLGDDYFYVGATVITKIDYDNISVITYCEDGLNDENGNPYLLKANVPKELLNRDRFIVFYTKDLRDHIIPIDGENYVLVGLDKPENVKNINYSKSTLIMQRKALKLSHTPQHLSKDEIKELCKRNKKAYKKFRYVFAGILMSLIYDFFLALIIIFTFDFIDALGDSCVIAVLIAYPILVIIGTVLIIMLFSRIPIFRMKHLQYRNQVLVLYQYNDGQGQPGIRCIIYRDGHYKAISHTVINKKSQVIKDLKYNDFIYLYSKTQYPVLNRDNVVGFDMFDI